MKVVLVYILVYVTLANGQADVAEPKVCVPDSTRKVDCNDCFCVADGSGWACTEMACPSPVRLPQEAKPVDEDDVNKGNLQVCEPGATKALDCNTCSCMRDGSGWACTRKACYDTTIVVADSDKTTAQPEPANLSQRSRREAEPVDDSSVDDVNKGNVRVCEPGDTKTVDCNTCFCAADGSTWGCTLKGCNGPLIDFSGLGSPTKQPEPANSEAKPVDEDDVNKGNLQVCEPGATKKLDCNTCSCNRDGSGWACTKMGCNDTTIIVVDSNKTTAQPEPATR